MLVLTLSFSSLNRSEDRFNNMLIAKKMTLVKNRANYSSAHFILNLENFKFQGFPQTNSGKPFLYPQLE